MATTVYKKTALTGGAASALDSIDGNSLLDGDIAFVFTGTLGYFYHLNATSGAAESSPDVISPDTNAGTKRWILQGLPYQSLAAMTSAQLAGIISDETGSGALVFATDPVFTDATVSGTGEVFTVTTDSAVNGVKIVSTSATNGPLLTLYGNSPSPAVDDVVGRLEFDGKRLDGNQYWMAYIDARWTDPATAVGRSRMEFHIRSADDDKTALAFNHEAFVGFNTALPNYIIDANGPINSRVYYWCDDFDDEASGVQFESGLNADFWTTAGTNYAAGNVTYLGGVGGTLKAMCAAADNDSVTILGLLNVNVAQNPLLEARIKIDLKETAAFYVGFASAAFADVNGAFPADCFLVGINSDNGHAFGATQIIAASVDNGAAVDYDDMGVAIVSNTYVKIKIDLTDTEQPRVWVNDSEVSAANITGTVQAGVALAPYFMVQNLAAGAIQRFVTADYVKIWADRG